MLGDLFREHAIACMLIDAGEVFGTLTLPTYEEEEDDVGDGYELTPELEKALVRKANAEARIAETIAKAKDIEFKNIKASDDANRVLMIDGPIIDMDGGVSCQALRATLMRWHRRDPGKDITVYLNTQGGSVFDGNTLMHTFKELRDSGHKVTIKGQGCVMSLGAIFLQGASEGERVLDKDTVFMIHSQSGMVGGSMDDRQDQERMLKGVQDRHLDLLAERSNLTKRQIINKTKRKDWFMSAQEALAQGFCDRVE